MKYFYIVIFGIISGILIHIYLFYNNNLIVTVNDTKTKCIL